MYGRVSSKIINSRKKMNADVYNNTVAFLVLKLDELDINYRFIKDLECKTVFESIRILVDPKDFEKVHNSFDSAIDFERCANVYSYLFSNNIHVDIILTDPENFVMSAFLYDYDDFGWLIQRCIEKHNTYHLFDTGLYTKYVYHYKEYMLFLTNDINTILNICQLDYDKYKNGFKTYIELFDYVSECPIFAASLFDIKLMPKRVAAKYKKHVFYKKLNIYIDKYDIPSTMPGKLIPPYTLFGESLKSQTEYIESTHDAIVKLKNHFNGNIVGDITGLKQPGLGKFMKLIRAKYTDDELIADAINIIKLEYKEGSM